MILRALEIIDHAKVHIAEIYLGSGRSIQDGKDFIAAGAILDRAGDELEQELAARPIHRLIRPFRARTS